MSRQTVTWDDFSGGHTQNDSNRDERRWHGTNVVAYRGGGIGPRWGAVEVTPTGFPAGKVAAVGFAPFLGWPESDMKKAFAVVGDKFVAFDHRGDSSAKVFTGSFAAAVEQAAWCMFDKDVYVTVAGDKTYKADFPAGTLTALTGSPGGTCIVEKNGYLIVGGATSVAGGRNDLFWSSVNDPTQWDTALGFWPVGDTTTVRAVVAVRDYLLVAKNDSKLYAVTGTIPEDFVTRLVATGGPIFNRHLAVAGSVPIMKPYGNFANNSPAYLLNGVVTPIPELWGTVAASAGTEDGEFAGEVEVGVVPIGHDGSAAFIDGSAKRAVVSRDGRWARHLFSQLPNVEGALSCSVGTRALHNMLLFSDGGAVGVSARFFVWNADSGYVDRPYVNGALYGRPGDVSDTPVAASVALSWFAHPRAADLQVGEVIVELESFDSGVEADNQLTVRCEFSTFDEAVGTRPSVEHTWVEALPVTTAGVYRRVRFPLRTPACQKFRLVLDDITGVKVRSVSAVVTSDADINRGV